MRFFQELLSRGEFEGKVDIKVDDYLEVEEMVDDRQTINFWQSDQPLASRQQQILQQLQQQKEMAASQHSLRIHRQPGELLHNSGWVSDRYSIPPLEASRHAITNYFPNSIRFDPSEKYEFPEDSDSEDDKKEFVILLKNTFGRPSTRRIRVAQEDSGVCVCRSYDTKS